MREQCEADRVRLRAACCSALCCAAVATPPAADIKIATVAPDGSHWMQQMRAGADEIKTRTGGRVTLKFYPGGVMGNDAQVLRKIRVGPASGRRVHRRVASPSATALNLYGIPLLFRSLDEVDAVRSAARSEARSRASSRPAS